MLANRLESVLDRVGVDTPEVRYAYRHALACELAFFLGVSTEVSCIIWRVPISAKVVFADLLFAGKVWVR